MNANRYNNMIPLVSRLPQITELLTDICTGFLMILLFGPFFYAIMYTVSGVKSSTGDLLIAIFPNFLTLFKDLHLATMSPWLVLGIAFILAFISRAVANIYSIIPGMKCIESQIFGKISFLAIEKWHDISEEWGYERIVRELINKHPFHKVGEIEYAEFRAYLANPSSEMNKFKSYWDHEEFLFLRYAQFYGTFLSFFCIYLIYGIIINLWKGLCFPEFLIWMGILIFIFLVVTFLFREVIIHGIAFIQIDNFLYDHFKKLKKEF